MFSRKMVYQHDAKDCGAACLCMIAQSFHKKYPIQQVRRLINTSQNGVSILNLVSGAEKMGLSAKAYEANIEDLKETLKKQLQIIAHLKTNHFVVADKIIRNQVVCYDPGEGRIKLSVEEFIKLWSGYIVIFEKKEGDQQIPCIVAKKSLPLELIQKYYKVMLSAFVMSFFLIMITICSTYVFQLLTDFAGDFEHAARHNDNSLIRFLLWVSQNDASHLLMFMLFLFAVMAGLNVLRGRIISKLSKKIDITLLEEYILKLLSSDVSNVTSRMTGDYISRISDLFSVRRIVSTYSVSFLLDVSMFIVGSIFLCDSNIKLYIFTLIALGVYMMVILFFRPFFGKYGRKIMSANASMQSYFKEVVQGMEFIKLHNLEKLSVKNFIDKSIKYEDALYKGNMLGFYSSAVSSYIEQVSNLIIIFFGFSLVQAKVLSQGEVVTIYLLFAVLSNSLKDILKMQSEVQNGVIALSRIQDIVYLDEEQHGQQKIEKIDNLNVENVCFCYPGKDLLLQNISFTINTNRKLAIVGENGSGKTTLIKLLTGLEKASSGNISFNGISIDKLEIKCIRDLISYVPQSVFLFADSLWNNITMGMESVTEEDVINACHMACLDDFINEQPLGLATFVDENGMNFSAGQKQAIAIARALIRKPSLLILDEATSNIDWEKENQIIERIMNLDIPCIWITHNPKIIEKADAIVDISGGLYE